MMHNGQSDFDGTLIEPEGVNAGAAADAEEETRVPHQDPTDAPPPPTEYELSRPSTDEMVGLPEQKVGQPGQQRSMDTS